jgi:hypothetical protein
MDKHINVPFDSSISEALKAGDYVYLTGTIYTARDAAHKRMYEALKNGEELPFDVKNNTIYYMGPSCCPIFYVNHIYLFFALLFPECPIHKISRCPAHIYYADGRGHKVNERRRVENSSEVLASRIHERCKGSVVKARHHDYIYHGADDFLSRNTLYRLIGCLTLLVNHVKQGNSRNHYQVKIYRRLYARARHYGSVPE